MKKNFTLKSFDEENATEKDILDLFLIAKKDWEEEERTGLKNYYTMFGLCHYFYRKHNISKEFLEAKLQPYWLKYATVRVNPSGLESWHFSHPTNVLGVLTDANHYAKERVNAINKVIQDLEKEIKDE
jgi:hypothetical protein